MAAISRHTWNVKISLWAAFVETVGTWKRETWSLRNL